MRRFLLTACLLTPLLFAACKSSGLTAGTDVVSSGRPDFGLRVPAGFRPLAAGTGSAIVPSDINTSPMGRYSYALYAGGSEHATALLHALVVELPPSAWRFALESDKAPQDIDFAKETRDGRFLTLRTSLVGAEGDWFRALAASAGLETAPVMLARRISYTPFVYTRVVVEYREPAPQCLRSLASEAPAGNVLWVELPVDRACIQEMRDFNRRADALLVLDASASAPAASLPALAAPSFAPDLELLCGTSEHVERGDPEYRQ